MRKYTRSFALLLLSGLGLLASCKKESDSSGVPPATDTTNTRLILSNLFGGTSTMTPQQSLEVNAGQESLIIGAKGTRIYFYPNSFKDRNGNIITSGQIQIKLVEMYKPGEVIANRSSATSFGRLLISGGQVQIKAYRAGQEVLANVYSIGFPAAATAVSPPMALFYGNNQNQDSIVTWTQAPINPGTMVSATVTDTTNWQPYYQFDSCTNFNWVNCDYFYNIAGQQMVNLALVTKQDAPLNKTNTQVFLVFPNINSVTYLQRFNQAEKKWTLSDTHEVPANMPFHALSLSLIDGVYYYGELKNLNSSYGFLDTLRPEPKSLPEVISLLNGL